jgi:hypothetical protein
LKLSDPNDIEDSNPEDFRRSKRNGLVGDTFKEEIHA